MPYQWNAERERLMLLLAVSSSNLKPSADTWAAVAGMLGEGLTPSAVSQKYYKLRKESVKLCNGGLPTPQTTPTKRKAPSDDGDRKLKQQQHQTPVKRPKLSPVTKEEDIDGELCSVFSSSTEQTESFVYPAYHNLFVPEQFLRYGMETSTKAEEMESNGFSFESGHT